MDSYISQMKSTHYVQEPAAKMEEKMKKFWGYLARNNLTVERADIR